MLPTSASPHEDEPRPRTFKVYNQFPSCNELRTRSIWLEVTSTLSHMTETKRKLCYAEVADLLWFKSVPLNFARTFLVFVNMLIGNNIAIVFLIMIIYHGLVIWRFYVSLWVFDFEKLKNNENSKKFHTRIRSCPRIHTRNASTTNKRKKRHTMRRNIWIFIMCRLYQCHKYSEKNSLFSGDVVTNIKF